MTSLSKLGKNFLSQLSNDVACPVKQGGKALALPSSAFVENEVYFRWGKDNGQSDRAWMEVQFCVHVIGIEKLWQKYSGRPGIPSLTCYHQIQDKFYPGYAIPVEGFSMSLRSSQDWDAAVAILVPVIKEEIMPLALACLDVEGVVAATIAGRLSAQRFNIALLFALSGRLDDALDETSAGKEFYGNPDNEFEPGNIMWRMNDALEKDIVCNWKSTAQRYH